MFCGLSVSKRTHGHLACIPCRVVVVCSVGALLVFNAQQGLSSMPFCIYVEDVFVSDGRKHAIEHGWDVPAVEEL